jgi:hypothetical protein
MFQSGAEALELARSQPRFNLIVTNLEVEDMDAAQLAREVKRQGLMSPWSCWPTTIAKSRSSSAGNPVTDMSDFSVAGQCAHSYFAIVKYIEDKRNVEHDTRAMGVPVLLVVEDNIRYYSSFFR